MSVGHYCNNIPARTFVNGIFSDRIELITQPGLENIYHHSLDACHRSFFISASLAVITL